MYCGQVSATFGTAYVVGEERVACFALDIRSQLLPYLYVKGRGEVRRILVPVLAELVKVALQVVLVVLLRRLLRKWRLLVSRRARAARSVHALHPERKEAA